ncbi:helix-turn-helix domain-containing protein [Skermania piniformis]|uniref:Helix-turn-helix domain-containing protein n=1 Tax=Skermania pinensis TaxID=39122 RepID=A0ABX8SFT2_9ACTN|nr:helix-turn-helix transcriptional regulator [Skermania piniformis]QXQ14551.1 helix-turn-helix domain-containing protein [Skermania piniformis]
MCDELGVTPAALSQYINGHTTPSLDKLVAFADLFKVSLDYLIFGEDAIGGPGGALDYGPLARLFELNMANVRTDIANQSAYVTKIGSILSAQVANAAMAVAKRPTAPEGMLDYQQSLELERFSTASTIVTMNLTDDILEIENGVEEGFFASGFLAVIAQNLARGGTYRFVLSPEMPNRTATVERYRALLIRHGVPADVDLDRCRFGVAREQFYVGFCIFTVDVAEMRAQSPILHHYLTEYGYLSADGEIGYLEPISSGWHVPLMDATHRRLALAAYERFAPADPHPTDRA